MWPWVATCVYYFSVAMIQFHDHGKLEKRELILASGSRERRIHDGGLGDKQQEWQEEQEGESSCLNGKHEVVLVN